MPGLITQFLGEGLAAARPATPDIPAGSIAWYYATDTNALTYYAEGAWNAVSGGGLSDGDKGDITVGSSGTTLTIDNDAVTFAKIQDISATSRILGRKTASAGDTEECTLSEILDFIGSAAQGDILYRGASSWARLGAGTSGQYLKTQGAGANPVWDTPAGGSGAWSLIESLTPSAVSSINSEAWAGGSYKALHFIFRLTVSNDGVDMLVRYKLNGSYKSAANYRYADPTNSSGGSGSTAASQIGTALLIGNTGATWGIGNNTLEHIAGEAKIIRPFDTTKPKVLISHTDHGAPSGAYAVTTGGGTYDGTDAANALAGLQFLVSAGTFTGTIDVLGLN